MTQITFQLEDSKAEAFRQKAERYGLKPEDLLRASVEAILGEPDEQFEAAAQRVLTKNEELYKRLS